MLDFNSLLLVLSLIHGHTATTLFLSYFTDRLCLGVASPLASSLSSNPFKRRISRFGPKWLLVGVVVVCGLIFLRTPAPEIQNIVLPVAPVSHCEWKFKEYNPSDWEREWSDDIEQRKNQVCDIWQTRPEYLRAITYIDRVNEFNALEANAPLKPDSKADLLFSSMTYELECSEPTPPQNGLVPGTKMQMMIEPLVGNTRDPFTICPVHPSVPPRLVSQLTENAEVEGAFPGLQSKRHLLMAASAPMRLKKPQESSYGPWATVSQLGMPNLPSLAVIQQRKVILFDLGAALFLEWPNSPNAGSTAWFVQQFHHKRGIKFTHIFAYEIELHAPQDVWDQVPEGLMASYHYINVGVSSEGKYNPWAMLRVVASPEDYVVIKLDVDSPRIENALVDQLLADPQLLSLVDEMTYEHHTMIPEMMPHWKTASPLTLANTYHMFLQLRSAGVRMHSWP